MTKRKIWKKQILEACKSTKPWIDVYYELYNKGIPHDFILKVANDFGKRTQKP